MKTIDLTKFESYDPPEDKLIQIYYNQGFRAKLKGLKESDNPYKPSGHERDTTYEDEMRYQWNSGYNDAANYLLFKINFPSRDY